MVSAGYKYSDLVDPYYDLEKSDDHITLPYQFDPASHTLLVGFMVGNSDQDFDVETPNFHLESIRTDHFNLVVACTFLTVPANQFGWFKIPKTTDPKKAESDAERLEATLLMRGVTPEICFKRLQFYCQGLLLNQLERWEKIVPDLPDANRLALNYTINEVVDGMLASAQSGENGYVELGPIHYYFLKPSYRSIRYFFHFKGSILSWTGYIFD